MCLYCSVNLQNELALGHAALQMLGLKATVPDTACMQLASVESKVVGTKGITQAYHFWNVIPFLFLKSHIKLAFNY